MRRLSLLPLVAATLLGGARPALSQQLAKPPSRPRLAAGADTNDWAPYYAEGLRQLRGNRKQARAAFYWASRLDPRRAEPYFGAWIAFWLSDVHRFERYIGDDRRVRSAPDVVVADSLRLRALVRSPFVHQGLRVMLYDELPGRWKDDLETRAWLAYARGDALAAVQRFGQLVERDTSKYAEYRYPRALAWAALGRADRAEAELRVLVATIEREQERRLVMASESTEQLYYAIGFAAYARGAFADARGSYQKAVEQNAAFYPAWAQLGRIGVAQHDTTLALRSLEQALQLQSGDPVVYLDYGQALVGAGRAGEAVVPLRRAIELEPYWAAPLATLGQALEGAGKKQEAIAAYERFLAIAPSSLADERSAVTDRLRRLRL